MALDEGRPAGRDGRWGVPIGRGPRCPGQSRL